VYPSRTVCEYLHSIDPALRLAWTAGSFCLVYLYPKENFGSFDQPKTFLEPWYLRPGKLPSGRIELVKVDRGPVFNKQGGLDPDWGLESVPIYSMNLKQFGFKNADVMNEEKFRGIVVPRLRQYLRPIKLRMAEDRAALLKDTRNKHDEYGKRAGLALHAALKAGELPVKHTIPYEDQKKEIAAIHKKRENCDLEKVMA